VSIRLLQLVLAESPLRGMALMAEVRLAEYVNESRDFDPVNGEGECFQDSKSWWKGLALRNGR
jgi:hypothetical protein